MGAQESNKDYMLLSEYLAKNPHATLPPITIIDDDIAMEVYDEKITYNYDRYYKSSKLTTLNSVMIEQHYGKIFNLYVLHNGEIKLPNVNFWTFKPYMFKVVLSKHASVTDKLRGL